MWIGLGGLALAAVPDVEPTFEPETVVVFGLTGGVSMAAPMGFGPGWTLEIKPEHGPLLAIGFRYEADVLLNEGGWGGVETDDGGMRVSQMLAVKVDRWLSEGPVRGVLGVGLGLYPTLAFGVEDDRFLGDLAIAPGVMAQLGIDLGPMRLAVLAHFVYPGRRSSQVIPRSYAAVEWSVGF